MRYGVGGKSEGIAVPRILSVFVPPLLTEGNRAALEGQSLRLCSGQAWAAVPHKHYW